MLVGTRGGGTRETLGGETYAVSWLVSTEQAWGWLRSPQLQLLSTLWHLATTWGKQQQKVEKWKWFGNTQKQVIILLVVCAKQKIHYIARALHGHWMLWFIMIHLSNRLLGPMLLLVPNYFVPASAQGNLFFSCFFFCQNPFFVRYWPNLVTWMHRRLKHIGGSDLRFWLRSLTHYCATNTSQHFSSCTIQCDEVTSRTRLGEYTRGWLAHISGTWSQFVVRGRLAQREL